MNDTLVGTAGPDFLDGGDGNDSLRGLAGNDTLVGGAGNDTLAGGDGDDLLFGDGHPSDPSTRRGGLDVLDYSSAAGAMSVNLATGLASGLGEGQDTVSGFEVVWGSAFDDTLIGSAADEVFVGGAGRNQITGGGGWDSVSYRLAQSAMFVDLGVGFAFGGGWVDLLTGIRGVLGSDHADTLIGSTGDDVIAGGLGNDSLAGGAGFDTLFYGSFLGTATSAGGVVVNLATGQVSGGGGQDSISGFEAVVGSDGADTLIGDAQANRLIGGGGADLLQGAAGEDTLDGGEGNDTLEGGDGDDLLSGGAGDDSIVGGAGLDLLSYDVPGAGASGTGIVLSLATQRASGAFGNDTVVGIEQVIGTPWADRLAGDAGANTLNGGAGDDTLEGGAGDDALFGDAGFDTADYSSNSGSLWLDLGIGVATGAGRDLLLSIERVIGSPVGDAMSGSESADALLGGGGADVLNGRGGDDTLAGGAGNDTLDGGAGSDWVDYSGHTASAVVVNLAAGTATGEGSDSLQNIENALGTALADTLTGDARGNVLHGGAGDDTLQGGDGDDTLRGGLGNDNLQGEGAARWDWVDYRDATGPVGVNLSSGRSSGAAGNDTLSGFEAVFGSGFADSITGSAADEVLAGEGGNDTLNGGAGVDVAHYGSAPSPVVVDLQQGLATGGAGTDGLVGIEGVVGSAHADQLLGDAGANLFWGGAGADTIEGRSGLDTLSYEFAAGPVQVHLGLGTAAGADGEDRFSSIERLIGSPFADSLTGSAGADALEGGAGSDTLAGGGEGTAWDDLTRDWLDHGNSPAAVVVNLASGTVQDGWGSTDQVSGFWAVRGSVHADRLTGRAGGLGEIFEGGAGNDTLDGGALTDTLRGLDWNAASYRSAPGPVVVNLATGQATGSAGADQLLNINQVRGSALADALTGSNRGDVVESFEGGAGADTVQGAGGLDEVSYAHSPAGVLVQLALGRAEDGWGFVDALSGIERVRGSAHADRLVGGLEANGSGAREGGEFFIGGAGNDTLDGGIGYDRADFDSSPAGVSVTLGGTAAGRADDGFGGVDSLIDIEGVRGSSFDDILTGSDSGVFESFDGAAGADHIDGRGGIDRVDHLLDPGPVLVDLLRGTARDGHGFTDTLQGIEDIRGSRDFADVLVGDGQANLIEGLGGDDRLEGGGGNDTLEGGPGSDTLDGGDGDDQLLGGNTTGREGTAGASDGADVLRGGAGHDRMWGGDGDDYLLGDAGDDTLDGGAGSDILEGGTGIDIAAYHFDGGGFGAVQLDLSASGTAVDVEVPDGRGGTDRLIAIAAVWLRGSPAGDVFVGGLGHDLIQGLLGDDWLRGQGGNDILEGGPGNDTLDGGAGVDAASYQAAAAGVTVNLALATAQNTVGAGVDTLTGIEALIGSAHADNLTGNAAPNTLEGGDGNDRLDGGAGADLMTGGNGDDTYVVGLAGDVIVEQAGGGTDTVEAYATYTLPAHVEALRIMAGGAVDAVGNALANRLTGGAGNNVLEGAAGDDTLDGGAGTDLASYRNAPGPVTVSLALAGVAQNTGSEGLDTLIAMEGLIGGNFNDRLTGNADANTLEGGAGDDRLDGGAGADRMVGGLGNDTYVIGVAEDVIVEEAGGGTDSVEAWNSYVLPAHVEALRIMSSGGVNATGNEGDNLLIGGSGNNVLNGMAGNDTLEGGDGNDRLDGGAGADRMLGGNGDDTYVVGLAGDVIVETAGGGTDTVEAYASYTLPPHVEALRIMAGGAVDAVGNAQANRLTGGAGSNVLEGAAGDDTLDGGAGTDLASYRNAPGPVTVSLALAGSAQNTGSEGLDTLIAMEGLIGGNFNDRLTGNAEANTLEGGAGDDRLDGGGAADRMVGGLGNDTYVIGVAEDVIVEEAGGGTDSVEAWNSYVLPAHVETLRIMSGGAVSATGNEGDNLLIGGSGNNVLNGMAGNDTLEGGDGNDRLDGGAGADRMLGGSGDDTYVVGLAGDVIVETANAGTDTVEAYIGYTLPDHVETLRILAIGAVDGTGNALDNRLVGGSGNNVLEGGAGNDTLDGGAGVDLAAYRNAPGPVTVSLALAGVAQNTGAAGFDTLIAIEGLIGSAFNDTLTGNAEANTLEGGAGDDRLDGNAGTDRLVGGLGNDAYVVDTPGDVIVEEAGGGSDTVEAWASYTLPAHVEDIRIMAGGEINATGNALNNTLWGNSGNNRLDGGAGADTMTGGAGDDTYVVDLAGDTVVEEADGGFDWVETYIDYTLPANVEALRIMATGTVAGLGNALPNQMIGGAGNNVLDGGAGADTLTGGLGSDTFVLSNLQTVDTTTDFVSGQDRLRLLTQAIGDYDNQLEGGVVVPGPGGFSTEAELVIVSTPIAGPITPQSAAAAIGSADAPYDYAARVLFAVNNGVDTQVYFFRSLGDDPQAVEAEELGLIAVLQNTPAIGPLDIFIGP